MHIHHSSIFPTPMTPLVGGGHVRTDIEQPSAVSTCVALLSRCEDEAVVLRGRLLNSGEGRWGVLSSTVPTDTDEKDEKGGALRVRLSSVIDDGMMHLCLYVRKHVITSHVKGLAHASETSRYDEHETKTWQYQLSRSLFTQSTAAKHIPTKAHVHGAPPMTRRTKHS